MNVPISALIKTNDSLAAVVLRLGLGGVMLPHGLQKTAGAFGGYGFQGTMEFFQTQLGMPWVIAFLVIMAESFGSLALLMGVLTRFCAASIVIVMIGAIVMAHWDNGFFMNWFGNQKGEGFEYHLLAIAIGLGLLIQGGGRWSVDRWLAKGE